MVHVILSYPPCCSHTNTQFASHHFLCLHASSVLVALYLSKKYLTNQKINTVRVSIDNSWFSWNTMDLIMYSRQTLTCSLKLWLLEAVSLRSMLVPMARSSRAKCWRGEGWFIAHFPFTYEHTTLPIFKYCYMPMFQSPVTILSTTAEVCCYLIWRMPELSEYRRDWLIRAYSY